ncbi:MAG: OmpH family outer membrane protein [Pseudomarimonas sp.]
MNHGYLRGEGWPQARPLRAVAWLLLSLLLAASLAHAQQPTAAAIVYVDMQRLIDSAPQVVQGRARLAQEFAAADAKLKQDQQRLDRLEGSVDGVAAEASEEAKVEAQALRRSIERSRARLNDELATRVQQETDKAWPLIEEAVADYAREQGFDLVLPGPVLYASGRIDITDRVLDRLRQTDESAPP